MSLLTIVHKKRLDFKKLEAELSKVEEDNFYNKAAELDEMRNLCEKGLDFC